MQAAAEVSNRMIKIKIKIDAKITCLHIFTLLKTIRVVSKTIVGEAYPYVLVTMTSQDEMRSNTCFVDKVMTANRGQVAEQLQW